MIKAILLDLDDTLLGNPTEAFVTQYMGLLSRTLTERLPVDMANVKQALLAAVHAVMTSNNPRTTNGDTFYATFDPLLDVDRALFDQVVTEFYRDVYPQLQQITQRRPGARRLVDWLLAHDYRVVVATNPFFPTTAVEQRLDWAGLPLDEVPFALVTTLETMHYSKPNPAYYEEILARIGVQSDEAIMVGDDWENDIIPAHQAGLNTYWVCGECDHFPPGDVRADGLGGLADFACRVQDEGWLETLQPLPLVPEQIVPRLKGNLAGLLGIVSDTPEHVWHMRPEQEEWSPIEVLCHLAESEAAVQRTRFELIAREENPFLSKPAEPPAPATRMCPEDAWQVALVFATEREHTIEYVQTLTPQQWQRPARHYIFGPTTLLEMAHFTAQHDRLHLVQLCQTIGKCV